MNVFVTVGTDVHPFDRLVGWADGLRRARPDLSVFVQYGTSRPPSLAEGSAYLDHDELGSRMAGATVIVSHGGPATISEARRFVRPVVVPRDPDRGEHVDGHQLAFASMLASAGHITLAGDRDTFEAAVAGHLAHRPAGATSRSEPAGVRRFAALADRLLLESSGARRTKAPSRRVRRLDPLINSGSRQGAKP